jgi:hypothetical protein
MTLRRRLTKLEVQQRSEANDRPEVTRESILLRAAKLGIDGEEFLTNPEYAARILREAGMGDADIASKLGHLLALQDK